MGTLALKTSSILLVLYLYGIARATCTASRYCVAVVALSLHSALFPRSLSKDNPRLLPRQFCPGTITSCPITPPETRHSIIISPDPCQSSFDRFFPNMKPLRDILQ